MLTLSMPGRPFPEFSFFKAQPKTLDHPRLENAERRQIVRDVIATGACNSELGVNMLMSVYPDQF